MNYTGQISYIDWSFLLFYKNSKSQFDHNIREFIQVQEKGLQSINQ